MLDEYLVYCDESGNDGPNYLNSDSPFYVLAGWVTPKSSIVGATVEIETFRQKHCCDAQELKFKTFKKKPWAVCELMTQLGQLNLMPVYVIAEKKYCVAGKIVETFLDPFYNNRMPQTFSGDLPTKQELANTFYNQLSQKSLSAFAEAYRAPTQSDLERVLVTIVDECKKYVNSTVSYLLEGSTPKLAEIAEAEVIAVETWGKSMGTLNLPCLVSFLMIIEQLGQNCNFRINKIVHDEQGPYQEGYRRAFQQLREVKGKRFMVEGMNVPYGALKMVEEFELQNSADQPMVQAADLLAGSIAHLATALIQDRKLHKQEIDLGGLIFPAILIPDIKLTNAVCSGRVLRQFGDAIRCAYPKVQNHTEEKKQSRWTSTLPSEGPLPLLPAQALPTEPDIQPDVSVKITLPLFGLANDDNELAILLPPEKTFEQSSEEERFLPLWTKVQTATGFLEENDWAIPHHVVEYGPREIPDLVNHLRNLVQWTNLVVIDPFTDKEGLCPIEMLANEIERIHERCLRAVKSGLLPFLVKQEKVGKHEVFSLLMSSGKYSAMKMPDGPMADGMSHEEAVSNLIAML